MAALEFKQMYKGMGSREVRELISNSRDFRKEIEGIYVGQMHQSMNHNCNDCYMDAYIVIMNTTNERIKAMETKEFELRAGAVLIDVVKNDSAKMCNSNTITDELALYHLATNPAYIRFFSRYPEDWQERAIKMYAGTAEAPKESKTEETAENRAETHEKTEPVPTTTETKKVAQKARKTPKKASK